MKSSRSNLTTKVFDSLRRAFKYEPGGVYTASPVDTENGTGQYGIATHRGFSSANLYYANKHFFLPMFILRSYNHDAKSWNPEIAAQDCGHLLGGTFAFQKTKIRVKGIFTDKNRAVPSGIPIPLDYVPCTKIVVLTNFILPAGDLKFWEKRHTYIIPLFCLDELASLIPKSAGVDIPRLKKALAAENKYFEHTMSR